MASVIQYYEGVGSVVVIGIPTAIVYDEQKGVRYLQ
jgi:hypothetical protein